MKKILAFAGACLALCATLAFADPGNVPLQNALEHVTGNSIKNPQAPGLQNAEKRIAENAARQEQNEHRHHRSETGRPDTVDRADHPGSERAAAIEAAASRPGRADPPGRSRR